MYFPHSVEQGLPGTQLYPQRFLLWIDWLLLENQIRLKTG